MLILHYLLDIDIITCKNQSENVQIINKDVFILQYTNI